MSAIDETLPSDETDLPWWLSIRDGHNELQRRHLAEQMHVRVGGELEGCVGNWNGWNKEPRLGSQHWAENESKDLGRKASLCWGTCYMFVECSNTMCSTPKSQSDITWLARSGLSVYVMYWVPVLSLVMAHVGVHQVVSLVMASVGVIHWMLPQMCTPIGQSGYSQCRCCTLGSHPIWVPHLHMEVPCWGAGQNLSYPNHICPCTPTAERPGYDLYTVHTHSRYLPSACSEYGQCLFSICSVL